MLELLDLEGILRGGSLSIWLLVFLLVLVFWLVRVVTDVRKEVSAVSDETKHTVSPAFLQRFTELNQIKQLERIRNAFRRASAKGGSGRFDLEIQREIDVLKANAGEPDEDEDQTRQPQHAGPNIPEEFNDFQD